jgi:capsular exopolysaccharide synthesis family protein
MPRSDAKNVILLHAFPDDPLCDAYRNLRINLDFYTANRNIVTIAITSAHPGEGKTTTILNLAVAYAHVGKKVLLIDADTRRPMVHQSFRMDNEIGLTNVLTKQNSVSEAIKNTEIPNLSIMTSGPKHYNTSELLASKTFDELLIELKQRFDVILIDTPPAFALMDAKIVAAKSDGVLLVVQYRKVKRGEANRLKEEFADVQDKLLGVAFNKINNKDVEMYSYY